MDTYTRKQKLERLWAVHTLSKSRVAKFIQSWSRWLQRNFSTGYSASALVDYYRGQPEQYIARDIVQALEQGYQASEGLRGWLPDYQVHVMALTEATPQFQRFCHHWLKQQRQHAQSWQHLLGLLGYGLTLCIGAILLHVVIVHHQLVPLMVQLGVDQGKGQTFHTAVSVAEMLSQWWPWLALVTVAVPLIMWVVVQNIYSERLHRVVKNITMISWYRTRLSAYLLHAMVTLVEAGESWHNAASMLRARQSRYAKLYLQLFRQALASGNSPAQALLTTEFHDRSTCLQLRGLDGDSDLLHYCHQLSEDALADSDTLILRYGQRGKWVLISITLVLVWLAFQAIYGIRNLQFY